MYYGDDTADKLQRRYRKFYSEDGSMEIVNDTQAGSTSFVFYLCGDAYSAPAIWKEVHTASALAQNLYFLHRDHLGSILMVTDVNGNIAEKRQFDAWGNIVNLTDGNGNPLAAFVVLDRGYTGHEHLFGVALIHMNARLYDPMLHRFLSPDNFVQDPSNTQNYNRYGYAMNNPVIYSDPTGEFIPLLIFAAAAFIGGGGNVWSHWGEIVKHPWSAVGYFASGAVGGAVAVVNPWAGGSIAAVGNVATDVAFGNLPKFNGIGSVAKYIGGIALDGLGAAGAGSISKWGYNVASQFGWVENVTLNGTSQIVSSGINTFSALAPEVSVTATKVPIASLLETAAGQAGKIAAKEGTNTVTRSESVLGHIFRDATGHVNPATLTSQNRYISLFENVANNPVNLNPNVLTNFQLSTKGFQGYSQIFRNGSQVWTQTFKGKIINAGVNIIPK